jgi:tyrosine-specific transport protein
VNKTLGGILLVSGTTIGAGMLALPVVTGFAGFIPSVALFFAYWVYMTFTALLILEVNLWMEKKDANMTTMARMTLGKWGEGVAWLAYLFLLYALTTAYLAGGGPIFNEFLFGLTGITVPKFLESVPLLVIFGYFVYHGAHKVDWVNRLLMVGLVATFALSSAMLIPYVNFDLLSYRDLPLIWVGSSVAATSFGFHIIIPTLTSYLNHDVKQLKRVIWIGSAIPLFVYLLWEFLVLGIVPLNGAVSLSHGYVVGANGAELLTKVIGNGALSEILRIFLLLAIITSFLGVSTSLTDFLADGFNVKKSPLGRGFLLLLTFGPPMIFALTDPRAFLSALEYAGAFGVVTLLGLLPAWMAWRGRKKYAAGALYQAPGGTPLLFVAMAISFGVIACEILQKMGVLWIKNGF